jgi:hypothetical protein
VRAAGNATGGSIPIAKTTMFSTALKNMKILAEGGKLPPRGVKPGI